jgi:hypothetical protein
MPRCTPVLIPNPPPLWHPMLGHCRTLMRDLGASAILIEGRLLDTPFGPKIVATMSLPTEMGPVPLGAHSAYRRAMRDAAGMITFARMAAHSASGIDPITASCEPEDVLWQLVVLPAGVVLIARTKAADFGPFLLDEREPDQRALALVGLQMDFAGITLGEARHGSRRDGPSSPGTQ